MGEKRRREKKPDLLNSSPQSNITKIAWQPPCSIEEGRGKDGGGKERGGGGKWPFFSYSAMNHVGNGGVAALLKKRERKGREDFWAHPPSLCVFIVLGAAPNFMRRK